MKGSIMEHGMEHEIWAKLDTGCMSDVKYGNINDR